MPAVWQPTWVAARLIRVATSPRLAANCSLKGAWPSSGVWLVWKTRCVCGAEEVIAGYMNWGAMRVAFLVVDILRRDGLDNRAKWFMVKELIQASRMEKNKLVIEWEEYGREELVVEKIIGVSVLCTNRPNEGEKLWEKKMSLLLRVLL